MGPSRSRARLAALGLCVALGIVAWNVVFDYQVKKATLDYVHRQALHEQGRGPRATIDGVMRPAIARGAAVASGLGALVTGLGVFGVMAAGRHDP